MDRWWLPGTTGDALHALTCALACNIRWLMRAMQVKARRVLTWLLQVFGVRDEHDTFAVVSRWGWLQTAVARLECWARKLGSWRPAGRLALAAA